MKNPKSWLVDIAASVPINLNSWFWGGPSGQRDVNVARFGDKATCFWWTLWQTPRSPKKIRVYLLVENGDGQHDAVQLNWATSWLAFCVICFVGKTRGCTALMEEI